MTDVSACERYANWAARLPADKRRAVELATSLAQWLSVAACLVPVLAKHKCGDLSALVEERLGWDRDLLRQMSAADPDLGRAIIFGGSGRFDV